MPAFLKTLFYPTISLTILFLVGCSRDNPLSVPDEYEEPIVNACKVIMPPLFTLTDINITDTILTYPSLNLDNELVTEENFKSDNYYYDAIVDHLINTVIITPVSMDIDVFNDADKIIPIDESDITKADEIDNFNAHLSNTIELIADETDDPLVKEELSKTIELIAEETSAIFGIKELTSVEIRLNNNVIDGENLSSSVPLIENETSIEIIALTQFDVLVNTEKKGETVSENKCVPLYVKDSAGNPTSKQEVEQQQQVLRYMITIYRDQFNEITISPIELANDISAANDEFGRAISLGSTTETNVISAAIGAPHLSTTTINELGEETIKEDSGGVFVYEQLEKNSWSDATIFSATKADNGDLFGYSVSFSDGFLAVSAPGEDSFSQGVYPWVDVLDSDNNPISDGINDNSSVEISNLAKSSGAVYLFKKNTNEPNGWRQEAFIKQPSILFGLENYDIGFGKKILLKDDILLIAAPQKTVTIEVSDVVKTINSGAVYVYRYTPPTPDQESGSWALAATLLSEAPGIDDRFGSSLAMHDGFILIGAPGENNGSGGAHLFEPRGTTWDFSAHLTASNSNPGDAFGNSVAIGSNKIFIGASKEDSYGKGFNREKGDNSLENSGAVYGYSLNEPEEPWVEFVYIKADNPMSSNQFGYDIKFDKTNLIIGEPFKLNGNSLGQVYLYEFIDNEIQPSTTIAYENIEIGTAIDNARFGSSLALFDSIFAVGANGFTNNESGIDKTNSGKAYIFQ
jgi:hypothetical protein